MNIRKLSLLTIVLLLFVPGVIADPTTPITSWGTQGSGTTQLNEPYDVAIDSEGFVYIADYNNHRIVKLSYVDGIFSYVAHIGSLGSGNSQFQGIAGITYGSDGNLYIADFGNYCVKVFDTDLNFIRKFGIKLVFQWGQTPPYPYGSFNDIQRATEYNGEIYVSDAYRHDVQVFDLEGNFIRVIGVTNTQSSDPGYFDKPRDIAIGPDGKIYISDESRIQVFEPDGTYIRQWGSFGTNPGQLSTAWGLTTDGHGRVYVVEWGTARMQIFESDGNLILSYGTFGGLYPQPDLSRFWRPRGIDIHPITGNIFIADTAYHRVKVHEGYVPPPPPPEFTPTGPPMAGFRYTIVDTLTLQFNSTSAQATSYLWEFGDGSESTDPNPIHTYSDHDIYTVKLTATNEYGDSTSIKQIYLHKSIRPSATATVEPMTLGAYNRLIGAVGGDVVYEGDGPQVDWMEGIRTIESVYSDSMGIFFYIMVFSLPFVIQWLRQGNMAVPGTLGIITAGYLLTYLPAEYHLVAVTFVALSVLAVIWGIVKERV